MPQRPGGGRYRPLWLKGAHARPVRGPDWLMCTWAHRPSQLAPPPGPVETLTQAPVPASVGSESPTRQRCPWTLTPPCHGFLLRRLRTATDPSSGTASRLRHREHIQQEPQLPEPPNAMQPHAAFRENGHPKPPNRWTPGSALLFPIDSPGPE